ncbi:hypothetical protein E2C01_029868 [Portunus trituberculatus]|uniref:Uncharacterized protein n=1 Tax=Portunus trituberculatus TaxID=210409 RepID=A0A5B7EPG1_PORTR|nr:hypothetical protein [Portunus trituberculatus]
MSLDKRDKPEAVIVSRLKATRRNGRLCGGRRGGPLPPSSSPSSSPPLAPGRWVQTGERKVWERRRPRGRGRKGERGEGRERVKPHGRRGSEVAAAAITFRPSLSFLPSGFTTPINVVCGTPSSCACGRASTHTHTLQPCVRAEYKALCLHSLKGPTFSYIPVTIVSVCRGSGSVAAQEMGLVFAHSPCKAMDFMSM